MSNDAKSWSETAQTNASGGVGEHQHFRHDATDETTAGTFKARTVGQDVNVDERFSVENADRSAFGFWNVKRTDLEAQSTDLEARMFTRRNENIDAERRRMREDELHNMHMRHTEAEHAQRMRHADFQVTALSGVTAAMVDALSENIAGKVCERLKKG